MAGIERIKIEVTEPNYYLDEEVTYAQTDYWFSHVTRDLRMDIIYPQAVINGAVKTNEKKYPCIVWICGGAFMQVSKNAHLPYLTDLARRGFVVASADYRLSHEAPFPGALTDIKAAIRYLRAHAKRYSIDTERFGVAGESAGGYLTAMTALSSGKEFEVGSYLEYSSAVKAACPWYMPCDLAKMFKETGHQLPFFNGDANDKQYCAFIDPRTYITPNAPPFLLFHGTDDTTVPFEQGQMMYDALVSHKVDAKLVVLEGEEHAGPMFFQRQLWNIMADFFKEKLL